MKTIQVAILNVVIPTPHNADRYIELFRTAYRARRTVSIRGDYHGLIGAFAPHGDVWAGQFYKFFNIDPSNPWFNISSNEPATEDDIAKITIPENLKPHHQVFDFVLFPREHRMVYTVRSGPHSLGTTSCKKLIDGLLSSDLIKRKFGDVQTTIEPHAEQLDSILALRGLRKLTIELKPPNPDDTQKAERQFLERMRREKAAKYTETLYSEGPEALLPDHDHQLLASIAKSNGQVTGTGVDESGRTITMSTIDKPLIDPVTFDPKVELLLTALVNKGRELVETVRGRRSG